MADDQLLQLAIARARQENPDVADAPIQPMGAIGRGVDFLRRTLHGGPAADASTSLFGSVQYNPDVLKGMNEYEQGDVLAHELQHVRQMRRMSMLDKLGDVARQSLGMGYSYGQNPLELEAFQKETDRQVRDGRQPVDRPSFTGAPTGADIWLPGPRKSPRHQ